MFACRRVRIGSAVVTGGVRPEAAPHRLRNLFFGCRYRYRRQEQYCEVFSFTCAIRTAFSPLPCVIDYATRYFEAIYAEQGSFLEMLACICSLDVWDVLDSSWRSKVVSLAAMACR